MLLVFLLLIQVSPSYSQDEELESDDNSYGEEADLTIEEENTKQKDEELKLLEKQDPDLKVESSESKPTPTAAPPRAEKPKKQKLLKKDKQKQNKKKAVKNNKKSTKSKKNKKKSITKKH